MIRHAENRTGGDSRGGSMPGRNMNREAACEGRKAIAMRREGQLFAEAETQKPRTYQIEPE